MTITDGNQEILEDEWTHGQDFPSHGHEWTGETWFEEKLSTEPRDHLKRPADPLVPKARITQKAGIDPEQMIPLSQAPMAKTEQPAVDAPLPGVPEIEAPPGLPALEPDQPVLPEPGVPMASSTTSMDASGDEPISDDRKRAFDEVLQPEGAWEELPASKRTRLELLEIYFTTISNKSATRQRKGKEATTKDFQGRDKERLMRAIQKEFNNSNNLATGAYMSFFLHRSQPEFESRTLRRS